MDKRRKSLCPTMLISSSCKYSVLSYPLKGLESLRYTLVTADCFLQVILQAYVQAHAARRR